MRVRIDGVEYSTKDHIIEVEYFESTEEQDNFMIFGEVPPHDIRNINNYVISC